MYHCEIFKISLNRNHYRPANLSPKVLFKSGMAEQVGWGGGGAHKEMRSKNFPFPYEDGFLNLKSYSCFLI